MSKQKSKELEMFALIEEWQKSGLTQRSFINEKNVSQAQFYYWLSRFKLNSSVKSEEVDPNLQLISRPIFQEFELESSSQESSKTRAVILEMTTPCGMQIKIFG